MAEQIEDAQSFKLTPELEAKLRAAKKVRRVTKQRTKRTAGAHYTLGPVPHSTIARAYRAHRAGLAVLLAVKTQADMLRRASGEAMPVVVVTDGTCSGVGVLRDARLAAIKALAMAGLLQVEWSSKRAPRVSIPAGVF